MSSSHILKRQQGLIKLIVLIAAIASMNCVARRSHLYWRGNDQHAWRPFASGKKRFAYRRLDTSDWKKQTVRNIEDLRHRFAPE
jgi:hypothetical protein